MIPRRLSPEEGRRIHRINQLRYKSEIEFIERILEDIMVVPMSDVWIYPAYPEGFQAIVAGLEIDEEADEDFVYVMDVSNGLVTIDRYHPAGVNPNGSLRLKPEREVKLRDKMVSDYTFWPY